MRVLVGLVGLLAVVTSLPGCAERIERLHPTGETISVPQAAQFCRDNPKDQLCSRSTPNDS